jgi:hypothetical protein
VKWDEQEFPELNEMKAELRGIQDVLAARERARKAMPLTPWST